MTYIVTGVGFACAGFAVAKGDYGWAVLLGGWGAALLAAEVLK